jgi:hypothetical protein
MQIEPGIYPIPQKLCTLAEKSAYIIAKNIYASADKDAQCASHILHDISLTNNNLYKALDEERNDPVTARNIIEQFALLEDRFRLDIAKKLTFPGAKKCLALSERLYDKNNTPQTIELLFKWGALINYQSGNNGSPLSYWTQSDQYSQNNLMIIEKLIALGADPNCEPVWGNNSFFVAIGKQTHARLNALLDYYTLMHGKSTLCRPVWGNILILYYGNLGPYKKDPVLIDILIANVPMQSCSTGLMACLDVKEDLEKQQRTQLMQKFINRGADAGPALMHLLEHVELWGTNYPDSDFIKNFNMLCDAGAFNEEALTAAQHLSQMFDVIKTKIENNRPK